MNNSSQQPVVFHWNADADGALTHFSGGWFDYTGLDEQESYASSDAWLSAVHPQDRERVQSIWASRALRPHRHDIELRIRGRDGLYRRFYGIATPVNGNDGAVTWAGYCMTVEEPLEHRTLRSA